MSSVAVQLEAELRGLKLGALIKRAAVTEGIDEGAVEGKNKQTRHSLAMTSAAAAMPKTSEHLAGWNTPRDRAPKREVPVHEVLFKAKAQRAWTVKHSKERYGASADTKWLKIDIDDVIHVFQDAVNGWYGGYMATDPSEKGWFPSDYVRAIVNGDDDEGEDDDDAPLCKTLCAEPVVDDGAENESE